MNADPDPHYFLTILNSFFIFRDGLVWSVKPILVAKDTSWKDEILSLVLEVSFLEYFVWNPVYCISRLGNGWTLYIRGSDFHLSRIGRCTSNF